MSSKPERVGDVWYPVGGGLCAVYRYLHGDRWQWQAHCTEHDWIAHPPWGYQLQRTAEHQAGVHMRREHGWEVEQ